jgi:hypothetical protein
MEQESRLRNFCFVWKALSCFDARRTNQILIFLVFHVRP